METDARLVLDEFSELILASDVVANGVEPLELGVDVRCQASSHGLDPPLQLRELLSVVGCTSPRGAVCRRSVDRHAGDEEYKEGICCIGRSEDQGTLEL
jgi:hypothetical protein